MFGLKGFAICRKSLPFDSVRMTLAVRGVGRAPLRGDGAAGDAQVVRMAMAANLLAGVLKSVAGWSACLFREGEGLWPGGGFCLSAAMKRSDGRPGRLPRAAGGRTARTESRRRGFPSPDKACSVIVGDINDRSFRGAGIPCRAQRPWPAERPAFKQRTRGLSDLRRTALAPAAEMRCSAERSGISPLSAVSSQASGKGRQCPASGRQILRCDRQAARRAWRGNGQGTWPLWSVGFPAGALPKPPGRCGPGYRIGSSGRRDNLFPGSATGDRFLRWLRSVAGLNGSLGWPRRCRFMAPARRSGGDAAACLTERLQGRSPAEPVRLSEFRFRDGRFAGT